MAQTISVTINSPGTVVWLNLLNVSETTPVIHSEITVLDSNASKSSFEIRGLNKVSFMLDTGNTVNFKIQFDILQGDSNITLQLGANTPNVSKIKINNDTELDIPYLPNPNGIDFAEIREFAKR